MTQPRKTFSSSQNPNRNEFINFLFKFPLVLQYFAVFVLQSVVKMHQPLSVQSVADYRAKILSRFHSTLMTYCTLV